jgi:hypothetical protein
VLLNNRRILWPYPAIARLLSRDSFMSMQLPKTELGRLELMRWVIPAHIEQAYCVPSPAVIEKVLDTRVSTILFRCILESSTLTSLRWLLLVCLPVVIGSSINPTGPSTRSLIHIVRRTRLQQPQQKGQRSLCELSAVQRGGCGRRKCQLVEVHASTSGAIDDDLSKVALLPRVWDA